MVERKRVIVSGVVQGVYFRAATQDAAEQLGVSGWVRNLPDGKVEAVFEGEADAVARAVAFTEHGPRHAQVTGVEVLSEAPEGLHSFTVRD